MGSPSADSHTPTVPELLRQYRVALKQHGFDLTDPEQKKAWRKLRREISRLDEETGRQVLLDAIKGSQAPALEPAVEMKQAAESRREIITWRDSVTSLLIFVAVGGFFWSLTGRYHYHFGTIGVLASAWYMNHRRESLELLSEGAGLTLAFALVSGFVVISVLLTRNITVAAIVAFISIMLLYLRGSDGEITGHSTDCPLRWVGDFG